MISATQGEASTHGTALSTRRVTRAFLIASSLVAAGGAIGILSVTGITTQAGGSRAAYYTALYLAVVSAATALTMPYGPRICHLFGTRRAFVLAQALLAVAWLCAGILIFAGAPEMTVLLTSALVFGICKSVAMLVAPMINKAYMSGATMSGAYARTSEIKGVAAVFGSILGGVLLTVAAPGWGMIINGLLFLPLALIAALRPPANIPPDPAKAGRPWRDIRDIFVTNRQMRTVAIVACAMVIFIAPLNTLIVPITDDLRQAPLLAAAGLLSAAIGLGRCFSAMLVDRLSRGRTELTASVLADVGAGVVLLLFALSSALLTGPVELMVWVPIGIAYGALRFAGRALNVGAANDAAAAHHPAQALAALFLVSSLVAPLGVMMWGILIDETSTTAAVTVAAIGIFVIIAAFTYRRPASPLSPGTD